MKSIRDFYNKRGICHGISGDRKDKMLPLLEKFKKSRVLDVGCATGYIGSLLKERGNYVVGWDMVVRDVEKARQVLDEAYVVDVESSHWPKCTTKFDLIIFSEVIEHLLGPERAVRKLLSYLKPGGSILVTTPNILHLYWRIRFLLGRFEYKEESVINPAHLHFFTYETLKNVARANNLRIEAENHVIFPRTLALLWKHWPNLFAYQSVLLLKKD